MTGSVAVAAPLARLKEIGDAGFAVALHIQFTTPTCLFQSYPKEWIDIYSQRGYVMQDPTVRWGFENIGQIRWSDLAQLDTAGVLSEASNFGLRYGLTFSIEGADDRSIASVARSDRELTDDEALEANQLLTDLHKLTSESTDFTSSDLDQLRQMSILFSHP